VDVYQLHREPAGWKWARDDKAAVFRLARPTEIHDVVAISLGVSATVVPNRIEQVLGKKVSIWSLNTEPAHNDVIRDPGDLRQFRQRMRGLLDEIKAAHQTSNDIHIFAAVPVSIAVELGRVRMPKADMSFLLYDETKNAGFVPRLRIG
jgi:flagellar motor switch/type III secretory pathway protein FliN